MRWIVFTGNKKWKIIYFVTLKFKVWKMENKVLNKFATDNI